MGVSSKEKVMKEIWKTPLGRDRIAKIMEAFDSIAFVDMKVSWEGDDHDMNLAVRYSMNFAGRESTNTSSWRKGSEMYLSIYSMDNAFQPGEFFRLVWDHPFPKYNVKKETMQDYFISNWSSSLLDMQGVHITQDAARKRLQGAAEVFMASDSWPAFVQDAKDRIVVEKVKASLRPFTKSVSDELMKRAMDEFICEWLHLS